MVINYNDAMNQHNSRKALALRFFVYGLMTLAVVVGVVLSLGWAMGFRFNVMDGQISQVALMQFDSYPQGANITVNGAVIGSQTATHLNVDTGRKKVVIGRDGYRNWSTSVNAAPSDVVWLNYARLVPNKVKTVTAKNFANFANAQMLASPDKNYVALQFAGENDFTLVNISNSSSPQFANLKIDAGTLTALAAGQTEKFAMIEWDPGSRYLLMRHDIANSDGSPALSEVVEVDTQGNSFNNSNSRNLTKDFNVALSDPHFSGNSGNIFFALTGTDVRKIDYSNNSLSAPLVSDVTRYRIYGGSDNMFAFTTRATDAAGNVAQTAGLYNDGKIITVRTFNDTQPTDAIFGSDQGTDYFAILRHEANGQSQIAIYPTLITHANNIAKIKPVVIALPFVSDNFANSLSGRFIVATNGVNVFLYDTETLAKYNFKLSTSAAALIWLDDYHLIDSTDGGTKFDMIDFTGQNRQEIGGGYGAVALSNDQKFIYSLANEISTDGKPSIDFQMSAMTTD